MTCTLCNSDGVPRHTRAAGKMVPLCSSCFVAARQGTLNKAEVKRLQKWEEPDGDTRSTDSPDPDVSDVREADDPPEVSPGQSVEVPAED